MWYFYFYFLAFEISRHRFLQWQHTFAIPSTVNERLLDLIGMLRPMTELRWQFDFSLCLTYALRVSDACFYVHFLCHSYSGFPILFSVDSTDFQFIVNLVVWTGPGPGVFSRYFIYYFGIWKSLYSWTYKVLFLCSHDEDRCVSFRTASILIAYHMIKNYISLLMGWNLLLFHCDCCSRMK